jgi:hypothetical protein
MSELIRKEHDVSIIMCHIVCPAKYRRAAISPEVDKKMREVCQRIKGETLMDMRKYMRPDNWSYSLGFLGKHCRISPLCGCLFL